MSNLEDLTKRNQEIAKILDELLKSGDWGSSLFLKVAGKQLHNLHREAELLVEKGQAAMEETGYASSSQHYQKPTLKNDETLLFISLYQSQGTDIDRWEETLRTLAASSIGRPVYGQESHAEQAIDARGSPLQEGYAIIHVKQADIIDMPKSRESCDRFGHVLLSLTEQAVKTENIHEFVHANQKRYRFSEGKLSLIKSIEKS